MADSSLLDRLIAAIDPERAVRRARSRAALAIYEAAQPTRLRKFRRGDSGPNRLVERGALALRTQMRYLERNHDITKGSLDVLVNNFVGPVGIGVEFQPRRRDGSIHAEYAAQLTEAWEEWQRRPEVTRVHDWQSVQRLVGRTFVRDGEAFAQQLAGPVEFLQHAGRVPLSLELLEPDLVPLDYNDTSKNIVQGCERNAWGQPRAWHVYRNHPGESFSLPSSGGTKRVPAERMIQVAELTRIGQVRGVTRYASVINRIEDIKDYEESERIAAKVAAMLTAYVKRQAPSDEGYTPQLDENGQPKPREIALSPGTVVDTLAVGEEIGLVDTQRPNVNLVHFRNGQLRAFASGINASASSVSRNYEGTYSAQRQELVEQWVSYAALTDEFVGMFTDPVVRSFIDASWLSGTVPMPADLKPGSQYDVLYIAPSMPWIDPAKEATAWVTLVQAGFASEVEVIRKRGQRPEALLEQVATWRQKCQDKGLQFNSSAGMSAVLQQQADDETAPGEQREQAQAMLRAIRKGADPLALVVAAMNRPQAAPQTHVTVQAPPAAAAPDVKVDVHNTVQPAAAPAVTVEVAPAAAPTVEFKPTIENHVAAAAPAQVVVQPSAPVATRQVFKHHKDGELAEVVTTPITH